MAQIIVTGGAGFIGSNLCLALENQGHEVVAADLAFVDSNSNLDKFHGMRVAWDTALAWPTSQLPTSVDIVFHQAALTDPRYDNDEEIYQKNVTGFLHALQFAESKHAKLVYASTAGLYGHGPTPMQEDQPKECLTAYGRSKLAMDEIANEWKTRLPLVGLRYFNVFGPREAGKGRPASMIYHLGKQLRETGKMRLFEHGEQIRDHIYVKDAVLANILASKKTDFGIYNVGTGIGTTFTSLAKTISEVLGMECKVEFFPMPYEAETYQAHTLADTTKARNELGFEAEWSLAAAVSDYFQWLTWLR